MNQGEFYLYSPDGVFSGVDTIRLMGGRFSHEVPCRSEGMLMLVFPNFSEVPIFAESGAKASLEGNAQHLKELRIKGTEANELMTEFRLQEQKLSPPEVHPLAVKFIKDNPESAVSLYLLRRFFLLSESTDFEGGQRLVDLVKSKQKGILATRLADDFARIKASGFSQRIPDFSARDVDGRAVSRSSLRGSVAVIYTWATWNFESMEIQRMLRRLQQQYPGRLRLLGINVDADPKTCRDRLRDDSVSSPVISDGMLFASPVLNTLGLTEVPDNVVLSPEGVVTRHGLGRDRLREYVEKSLKK